VVAGTKRRADRGDEVAPAGTAAPGGQRQPRADARRNRERLLEAAKAAFGEDGADVSLDQIARRADVGIGTLYRHFATRDAIVEAVYRREVAQLADAAPQLLATLPPGEALTAWMRLFIDYIAAKKVIAPALGAMVGGASELYASSTARILEAMSLLLDHARASGDIRPDIDPMDLLRALAGFAYVNTGPDWKASAHRLVDILLHGLKAPKA
jgi:AcrR family transcriptional regulator